MKCSLACVLFSAFIFVFPFSCVHAEEIAKSRSFLHMADGKWYDPASGLTGETEGELRQKLPTSTPPLADDFALMKAIRRGREILQATVTTTSTSVAEEPDWYVVDLAVWNSVSDRIEIVSLRKKGMNIHVLTPDVEEGTIRVVFSARLHSQYKITAPTGTSMVVGVKYPFYKEMKKGKQTSYLKEDVVYTPYSADLQTEEMTTWGKTYLDGVLKEIYLQLQEKKVTSTAFSDRFVNEVIHPNLPKAVMLIEQSDRKSLEQNPQQVLQRFYTTIGANEDRAYAYVESPAGAGGPAQFMPSTYRLLTKQKNLDLEPEFTSGTRSLRNSMKAQIIYLDRLLAAMPDSIQTKHGTDPNESQEYLVAAYNGGEGRIRRAISQWGDDWLQNRFKDLSSLQVEREAIDVKITTTKKKMKSLQGVKLKQEKKNLTRLQERRQTVSRQMDQLNKAALRPETLEYLVKYRHAIESFNQEPSSSS